MDTREAIELVEKAFSIWEDEYCLSEVTAKGMNEVIALLKYGEKFEKIWELLKASMEGQYCITPMEVYFEKNTINQQMKNIEQKYFPKDKVIK